MLILLNQCYNNMMKQYFDNIGEQFNDIIFEND